MSMLEQQLNQRQTNGQPAQTQIKQPGIEEQMNPRPIYDNPSYIGSGKLTGKTAIITGGDSGIGRAVALAFAKEGANVSIVYFDEHEDAKLTKQIVEAQGVKALVISGDVGNEQFCHQAVQQTFDAFARLDILVNNAAEQHYQESIENISANQLHRTFQTNIYSQFYFVQAARPYLKQGSSIINTASIVAYKGSRY